MNARTHPAGYTVYEYLLVLTPHEDLRNRIIHIRKEFQEKYKTGLQGGQTPCGASSVFAVPAYGRAYCEPLKDYGTGPAAGKNNIKGLCQFAYTQYLHSGYF